MIYSTEIPTKLEQGDILTNLPKVNLFKPTFSNDWLNSIKSDSLQNLTNVTLPPTAVTGVLLNQSCDISKDRNLVFSELVDWNVNLSPNPEKRANQKRSLIRDETRSHYFPEFLDVDVLDKPKSIDFREIFLVPANLVITDINLFFRAKLLNPAVKILQEKISRFFTRLAFDDEIFLTNEEIKTRIQKKKIQIDDAQNALKSVGRSTTFLESES